MSVPFTAVVAMDLGVANVCLRRINPFSITPVGPLPDILKVDEEVPAVKFAEA